MQLPFRPNWPLAALLLWSIGLLGIGIQGYLRPRTHTVYDIYVFGAEDWMAGRDIYIWQPQTGEMYRYSTLFAVVTSAFAQLPLGVGNALWKVLNGLIFVYAVLRWAERGLPQSPLGRDAKATLLLLTVPVVMFSLHIGQANLIMVGFILLASVAIREESWWQAATWLSLAVLIKVVPLPLALVCCVLFPLTFAWRFIITMLIGLLLPMLTQSPAYVAQQTLEWVKHLSGSHELNQERNRNLSKLIEYLGYPQKPDTMLVVGALAGGLVLLVAWVTLRRTGNRGQTMWLLTAWFLTWALLHNPASEAAAYGIIGPVIAWAVMLSFRQPEAWISRVVLLISLFLMGPALTDIGRLFPWMDQFWTAAVGALLLQGWLIVHTLQILRQPATSRAATSLTAPPSEPPEDASTVRGR